MRSTDIRVGGGRHECRRPTSVSVVGRMTTRAADVVSESRLRPGDERALAYDVLDGLTRPFKELPPKHLHDREGPLLFDRIRALPEHYPTRPEAARPAACAAAILQATGAAE